MTKEKLLNKAILYFTLNSWQKEHKDSPFCSKCKCSDFSGNSCSNEKFRIFLWFNRVTKKDTKIMDNQTSIYRCNTEPFEKFHAWCVKWLDDK